MNLRDILLSALLAFGPVVATGATTGEEDTIVINPINGSDFEVIQGTNFGAAEFWCGAATYVEPRPMWSGGRGGPS